jgi:PAS domain S-box-containing protein
MNTALLWIILFLLALSLIISAVVYIAIMRRRTAEIRALAEKLARESEEHRESESRYRRLIENAPDAIITLDPDGKFSSINPFCESLTSWKREEWMGRQFFPVVHSDDLPRAKTSFSEALNGKKTPMMDLRVMNKAGEFIWMEFIFTPQTHHDKVTGVLAIGRDISARHIAARAQEALELQLRRAQKMEAIGRLAGGIAHDFNNFLTIIMANCGLARMDVIGTHPAAERLEQINRASLRAAALVQQILTFSSNREQERNIINLKLALKEVTTMLRSTLPRSIEVRTKFASDCPSVLADVGQIQQVILNLATNAAHAMRESGGVLDVSLSAIEVDEDLAMRNPELHPGPYVRLTVSDSGHGMDAATMEHIFEPFFTTKPQGEGSGLGLSVVHGIVKSHDGAINVYSELGRGTSFNIYFPAAQGDESSSTEHLTRTFPMGHGEHILFVDDEPSLTEIGQRMLERLGYKVTTASSGNAALELIRSRAQIFDCIITDFTMPGISGTALARECRTLIPNTPIILMSGYCGVLTAEALRLQGIHDLILKPFTPQIIAEALRRALSADPGDHTSN